jgi:hypothetical protein
MRNPVPILPFPVPNPMSILPFPKRKEIAPIEESALIDNPHFPQRTQSKTDLPLTQIA